VGNILIVAAISVAGMAVAFPIGAGLALVLGARPPRLSSKSDVVVQSQNPGVAIWPCYRVDIVARPGSILTSCTSTGARG
jgi:hypothetical protein